MSSLDKATAIIKCLREQGYESYLAGGCVRDMLLNKTPQDYDITTSAKPDAIAEIFPLRSRRRAVRRHARRR